MKWRIFCLNQRGLYAQVLCRLRRILRVISAKMIWAGSIRVLSATMRIGTREMLEITLRADTSPTCLSTLASFVGTCLAQKHNWTTTLPEVTRSYTCSRLGQNNSFNTFFSAQGPKKPWKAMWRKTRPITCISVTYAASSRTGVQPRWETTWKRSTSPTCSPTPVNCVIWLLAKRLHCATTGRTRTESQKWWMYLLLFLGNKHFTTRHF